MLYCPFVKFTQFIVIWCENMIEGRKLVNCIAGGNSINYEMNMCSILQLLAVPVTCNSGKQPNIMNTGNKKTSIFKQKNNKINNFL